jgi:glyoxylase-like metal-dependent hydrolase (beta-lactamase superfamily II)
MLNRSVTAVLLVLLALSAGVWAEEPAEPKTPSWQKITDSVWEFSAGLDNVYLLKSEDRGVLFGAGEPLALNGIEDTGVTQIEYIFLWNTRREQLRGLRELVAGLGAKFAYEPRIAAPNTQGKGDEEPENAMMERNREFWESRMWRMVAGQVTTNPNDLPFFTLKPALYYRIPAGAPNMQVTWGGYTIDIINTWSPHRKAHSFVFKADSITFAVSGRLVLEDGRFRHTVDIWSDEYADFYREYEVVPRFVEVLQQRYNVEMFLPELGSKMTSREATMSVEKAKARLSQLGHLHPTPIRMNSIAYPGIQRLEIEGVSHYIIVGGENHYFLVNAGFVDALNAIPEAIGPDAKVDGIFVTDCRDFHAVTATNLSESLAAPVIATPSAALILRDHLAVNYPKCLPRPVKDVREVADGTELNWRGAKLKFHDLGALGPGKQVMVMTTPGSRVLFLGDALVNHRRFPFPSPWYSPDMRPGTLQAILKKITDLQPTFVADDWGIVEWGENGLGFDRALEWAASLRRQLADMVHPSMQWLGIDPFWARFVPDSVTREFGEPIDVEVRVRNYGAVAVEVELSLVGEYLTIGAEWKQVVSVEAQQVVKIPVRFAISADCLWSATAVGLRAKTCGIDSVPSQIVVLRRETEK